MSGLSLSTSTDLKGKRKKKIPPNSNPLFTQWLTEWKQEASEKGWKSAHTYAKALKTLKIFPLPLASGKDCKLLKNFGDKICKMLDEKLTEYKHDQGNTAADLPARADSCYKSNKDDGSMLSKLQIMNNKNTSCGRMYPDTNAACLATSSSISRCSPPEVRNVSSYLQTGVPIVNDVHELPCQTACSGPASVNGAKKCHAFGILDISDSNDSDHEAVHSPQKKKSRAACTSGREYVPAFRSGPYALILVLYKYMQDAEFKGFMTKSELSHAAQPFSDKSFTVPDAGGRYTAWSSMGTLIKKGFILKTNSPARYTLTDEGCQLGQRLYVAETQDKEDSNDILVQNIRIMDSSHVTGLSIQYNLQERHVERRNIEINNLPWSNTSEPIDHLQQQNISSDEEDDINFSIAVTKSVLSYSQEESKRSSLSSDPFKPTSLAGDIHHTNEQLLEITVTKSGHMKTFNDSLEISTSSSSSINNANDEGILIVSDDDEDVRHVLPARTWAQYHSLSPSQSSPPVTNLFRLPSPSLSVLITEPSFKTFNADLERSHKEINSTANIPAPFIQHLPAIQANIVEINDSSDDDTKKVVSKKHGSTTNKNYLSDDDELPDLVLPLSKRLAQRGHAESELLKRLAPQSSVPQKSVIVTDQQTIYNRGQHEKGLDNFTDLKAKPVSCNDHVTYTSATVLPGCLAPDRPHPCHIFSSSSSLYYSHSAASINTQDFMRTGVVDVFQKDARGAKIVHDSCENLMHSKPAQALSSAYVPQSSSTAATVITDSPTFTFQPGSFDIILCLDNREFYGSKGSSKTLLPELMKNGIQCDLRLLHVGDLLWIARERVEHQTERRGKELVLHYIVERKRMDDLVNSMTDGRLKEQKFRLKHCGLSELIILIEEYGSIQNFSISEDRIKQSIVNSQIIDGFRVKRCGSAKDAVIYLATMTRFLSQYYSTKTLCAVSLDQLKLLNGRQTLQKQEHFLIPFDVFNEASVKHKDLTVKEMFGKQLIQVPGVSAERAKAITNVYPSFSILMSAYERCANDKDRQRLLSGIKCGKKERNLGTALSHLLCMLYTQKGSLS